jgi:two-component system sensor histidine kinase/response regulator
MPETSNGFRRCSPTMPTTTPDAEPHHRLELTGRKILIVEDDRMNARIITSILRPAGFKTLEVETAERAIEVLSEFEPDLVLLDVELPGMNGYEACQRIKGFPEWENLPVIFITARNQPEDVVHGLEAGGIDYVVKPFQAQETLARIRTHLNLRLLMEQQVKLIDDLSRANAAKNHFLGIAAHDLRNPLTSIRGLAEFLMEGSGGEVTEDQRAMLKSIHGATQSMLELLNELLDISIIESGEMHLERVPTDFADLVAESVGLNAITAAKKQMTLRFEPPRLQHTLLLDRSKIRQVADNLLSNAIKFSPPGAAIEVELIEEDRTQTLSVRDQGPGIPEGEMGKLFQNFGKTSVRPTGGEKSTGLGLAICRKIVEAHQGRITVANNPRGGADFRVSFTAPAHGI